MNEDIWADLAESMLTNSATTTDFPAGHAICSNTGTLRRCTGFAAWKHDGQFRKGAISQPYIHHPIEVAAILVEVGGITDLDILQAALLHDTIEDTETTARELNSHFGERISGIVVEVSDDKTLEKAERKALQIKHAPLISAQAQVLKLADKIANVRDIGISPPVGWSTDRQMDYFQWSETVVNGLRDCNDTLAAWFDQQVDSSRRRVDGRR
jgi:guanosine-3',5'-bis(diphosphate) 3'-pyrophosphohydrolase